MIGNTNCRFNALSSEIRCNINPSEPCQDCSYFEAVDNVSLKQIIQYSLEQRSRNLLSEVRTIPSTIISNAKELFSIVIHKRFRRAIGVIVSIFITLTLIYSILEIPDKYFMGTNALIVQKYRSFSFIKGMIAAYYSLSITYFLLAIRLCWSSLSEDDFCDPIPKYKLMCPIIIHFFYRCLTVLILKVF